MTWFFVFMTIFGWRISPISGNTTNVKEACYGRGLSQFCIVQIDVVPAKRSARADI